MEASVLWVEPRTSSRRARNAGIWRLNCAVAASEALMSPGTPSLATTAPNIATAAQIGWSSGSPWLSASASRS